MGYMTITLIVTLSSSLYVALVINPAMASLFMKEKLVQGITEKSQAGVTSTEEQPAAIQGKILTTYSKILNLALDRPLSVIVSGLDAGGRFGKTGGVLSRY